MSDFVNPLKPRQQTGVVEMSRRLKLWTREILGIGEEDVVTVSQLSCAKPDCPPRETVVLVLAATGGIRKISIHRAMSDIDRDCLAAAWAIALP